MEKIPTPELVSAGIIFLVVAIYALDRNLKIKRRRNLWKKLLEEKAQIVKWQIKN